MRIFLAPFKSISFRRLGYVVSTPLEHRIDTVSTPWNAGDAAAPTPAHLRAVLLLWQIRDSDTDGRSLNALQLFNGVQGAHDRSLPGLVGHNDHWDKLVRRHLVL